MRHPCVYCTVKCLNTLHVYDVMICIFTGIVDVGKDLNSDSDGFSSNLASSADDSEDGFVGLAVEDKVDGSSDDSSESESDSDGAGVEGLV